jgi:hypothetical protein
VSSLTPLTIYLTVFFALAAVSIGASVGVAAEALVRNRRARLTRHESMRVYYGRLALHH